MYCRCGECGRFTSHWRFDESFCHREVCYTILEGPHIPGTMTPFYRGPLAIISPRAIMCDECKDALDDEVDGQQSWM